MKTNVENPDDKLFDRLVDGELSNVERQQLLASLDDRNQWTDDSGWRRCALAFLESQAWGTQLKQLTSAVTLPKSTVLTPSPEPISRPGRWLALAAGLLLSFSLGWIVNGGSGIDTGQTQLANNGDSEVDAGQLQEGEIQREEMPLREALPIGKEDAVTLVVRDTSGKQQRLQLPLLEAGDLDRRFAEQFGAALPAQLRDSFRDQGFDLQRRRRFAPMYFEQNEELVPMVVPVDDTTIVPVSRPVY